MQHDPAGQRWANGVFKGGGAKGVAYAGALKALEAEGIRFGSVAGASAGAITATLIAAGMSAADIESAVPDALAAAQSPKLARVAKAVIGHATSVFESKDLRAWIDATLHRRTGKQDAEPVTFRELHAAFGIELYVVVMDLSSGLPIVFSRRTTPDVEVAGAVTSSSAIPGAFPAGRAVFDDAEDGALVHQLVDGGAWANYPSFVFEDASFRAWLRHHAEGSPDWDEASWQAENDRPVVGCILGDPRASDRRRPVGMIPATDKGISRRFDLGPTYTSDEPVPFIFGSLLSSDWARLCIGLALAIWVSMSVVTLPIGLRRLAVWLDGWLPDALYPIVLVMAVTIVVLAAVVSLGLVLLLVLIGRLIADTVLPTMKALMGVPTDVAPWIGEGGGSIVLRVPHRGLSTTRFKVTVDKRTAAVTDAEHAVRTQLRSEPLATRMTQLFSGPPAAVAATKTADPDKEAPRGTIETRDRASLVGFALSVGAALLVGWLGWMATNHTGKGGLATVAWLLAAGIVGVSAGSLLVATRSGNRAAGRATVGVTAATRPPVAPAVLAFVSGIAAVGLGIATAQQAMNTRSRDTASVVVQSAALVGDKNHYTATVNGAPIEFTTERHLRLGERVYISTDDTPRLVGPLEGSRFGIAVFLTVLGLGLLTSAVKRWRWITRCRSLLHLVDRWQLSARDFGD